MIYIIVLIHNLYYNVYINYICIYKSKYIQHILALCISNYERLEIHYFNKFNNDAKKRSH